MSFFFLIKEFFKKFFFISRKKTLVTQKSSDLEDIRSSLIGNDFNSELVEKICNYLITKKDHTDIDLKNYIINILNKRRGNLFQKIVESKSIVFFTGVNGSGKTSTLIKVCNKLKKEGKKIAIIGGDTFRAEAVTQIEKMSLEHGFLLLKPLEKEKSSTLVHRSLLTLTKENYDSIIVDTAGFSYGRKDLMQELSKIVSMGRKYSEWSSYVINVIDSNMGQTAIKQVQNFFEAVKTDGIIFTKLDRSVGCGIIASIAESFPIEILFTTEGKTIDDIKDFDPDTVYRLLL